MAQKYGTNVPPSVGSWRSPIESHESGPGTITRVKRSLRPGLSTVRAVQTGQEAEFQRISSFLKPWRLQFHQQTCGQESWDMLNIHCTHRYTLKIDVPELAWNSKHGIESLTLGFMTDLSLPHLISSGWNKDNCVLIDFVHLKPCPFKTNNQWNYGQNGQRHFSPIVGYGWCEFQKMKYNNY